MDNVNFDIDEDETPPPIRKQGESSYVKNLRPTSKLSIGEESKEGIEAEISVPNTARARALSTVYDPFKSYNQSQKISTGGFINKGYLISAIGLLRMLIVVNMNFLNNIFICCY